MENLGDFNFFVYNQQWFGKGRTITAADPTACFKELKCSAK